MKIARAQKLFLLSAFGLTIIGLVALLSVSIPLSQKNFGESYFYFKHQLIYGLSIGLVLFFIARKIPPALLKKLALPVFLSALILLTLVHMPGLGYEAGGAQRWLLIGGVSFQPSEYAKLALIIYLASWLDRQRRKARSISAVASFLVIVGLAGGLVIAQRDLGTTLLLGSVALIMYIAGGARWRAALAVMLVVVVVAAALIAVEPYRVARFFSFIGTLEDTQGRDYQLNQALIAIGSGGLWGRGLGQSIQKFEYLPEAMTDSIFAIMAEELGFAGSVLIIGLFLLFIISGLKLAQGANTNFVSLLIIGVVSWVGVQALLNIGGISKLIPFTGIPLPFISYGGSALALELAAVGLVSGLYKR